MTVWQSFQMISPAQWAYAAALVALFWWRGPSPVALVLLADFVALLAIAGAMDFGMVSATEARLSMLVVWVVTAAVLAMLPGPGKVIAVIAALVLAAFIACLLLGVAIGATSAIVNAGAFIMLAVAAHGMGTSGGSGRGRADMPLPVGLSGGNMGLDAGGMARGADLLSASRGG